MGMGTYLIDRKRDRYLSVRRHPAGLNVSGKPSASLFKAGWEDLVFLSFASTKATESFPKPGTKLQGAR